MASERFAGGGGGTRAVCKDKVFRPPVQSTSPVYQSSPVIVDGPTNMCQINHHNCDMTMILLVLLDYLC